MSSVENTGRFGGNRRKESLEEGGYFHSLSLCGGELQT